MLWRSCLEVMHCHARTLPSLISLHHTVPSYELTTSYGGHVWRSCIAMPALSHLSSVSITQYRLIRSRRVMEVMSGGHVLPCPLSLISLHHTVPSYEVTTCYGGHIWRSSIATPALSHLSSVSITQYRLIRSRRVMEVMSGGHVLPCPLSLISLHHTVPSYEVTTYYGGHVWRSCITMPALSHLSSVSITQYWLIGSRRVMEVMSGGHVLPCPLSLISHQSPSCSTVL